MCPPRVTRINELLPMNSKKNHRPQFFYRQIRIPELNSLAMQYCAKGSPCSGHENFFIESCKNPTGPVKSLQCTWGLSLRGTVVTPRHSTSICRSKLQRALEKGRGSTRTMHGSIHPFTFAKAEVMKWWSWWWSRSTNMMWVCACVCRHEGQTQGVIVKTGRRRRLKG